MTTSSTSQNLLNIPSLQPPVTSAHHLPHPLAGFFDGAPLSPAQQHSPLLTPSSTLGSAAQPNIPTTTVDNDAFRAGMMTALNMINCGKCKHRENNNSLELVELV